MCGGKKHVQALHVAALGQPHYLATSPCSCRDPGQDGQEAIPAHIYARLFEPEGQNERLQRELAALEQGAGQSGRAAADVQSQLREVQEVGGEARGG